MNRTFSVSMIRGGKQLTSTMSGVGSMFNGLARDTVVPVPQDKITESSAKHQSVPSRQRVHIANSAPRKPRKNCARKKSPKKKQGTQKKKASPKTKPRSKPKKIVKIKDIFE